MAKIVLTPDQQEMLMACAQAVRAVRRSAFSGAFEAT